MNSSSKVTRWRLRQSQSFNRIFLNATKSNLLCASVLVKDTTCFWFSSQNTFFSQHVLRSLIFVFVVKQICRPRLDCSTVKQRKGISFRELLTRWQKKFHANCDVLTMVPSWVSDQLCCIKKKKIKVYIAARTHWFRAKKFVGHEASAKFIRVKPSSKYAVVVLWCR